MMRHHASATGTQDRAGTLLEPRERPRTEGACERAVPVRGGEWRIIIDEPHAPADHMACDDQLALDAVQAVRFFLWDPPAISRGWKQEVPPWGAVHAITHPGDVIVERPTGGGIAFHGSDLSVASVIPRALNVPLAAVMGTVCESAARLCRSYGADVFGLVDVWGERRIAYCLAEESSYAVVEAASGVRRKIGGFALRRYRESWLIQGSLLIRPIPETLIRRLPEQARTQLAARAESLSRAAGRDLDEREAAGRWARRWTQWWEELLIDQLGAADQRYAEERDSVPSSRL
jgi:lipoate-protein ligase A